MFIQNAYARNRKSPPITAHPTTVAPSKRCVTTRSSPILKRIAFPVDSNVALVHVTTISTESRVCRPTSVPAPIVMYVFYSRGKVVV